MDSLLEQLKQFRNFVIAKSKHFDKLLHVDSRPRTESLYPISPQEGIKTFDECQKINVIQPARVDSKRSVQ